ncbi:MAG: class I SAM-dependent methyltransferase [Gammaproteobacteria bacterium]
MDEERKRLDAIAAGVSYASGIGEKTNQYAFRIIRRHYAGGCVWEAGAAEGALSEKLAELDAPLTLLDGAEKKCVLLRRRFPNADVVHSLIEEYEPETGADNIVASHVLEHVADADAVMRRLASWLNPGGRLFVFTPNAMSVHRQAAALMGLLPHEEALNETDKKIGHRRVFHPLSLRRCVSGAGLRILHFGGYWLKPVSNAQIESHWDARMTDAFLRLGENYPDIAAEIYAVAEKP